MKTKPYFFAGIGVVILIAGFVSAGTGTACAGSPGIGMTTSGGAAVSTGHAASGSTGGTHASSVPASSGASTGTHLGAGGGSHATGLISTGVSDGGTPRYLPGGFSPNAGRTDRPSASHGVRPSSAVTPTMSPQNTFGNGIATVAIQPRARNAWTDPSQTELARADGNRHHGNHSSGTVLFPNAYQDAFGNPYRSNNGSAGWHDGRFPRYRFRHRGYYNGASYGYPFYPGLYGTYTPYVYNDIAEVGPVNGDYADDGAGSSNAPSADAVGNLSRPYPTESAELMPGPSASGLESPPSSANPTLKSNSGPDSLVEAVQAELARRGYFGGKVDAVYNEATHTALQRFQTDQQLSVTGRINEATLHALQLD